MSQNEEVLTPAPAWWTTAVVYQIYPRSFADSNGDGIGDLGGIRQHLDHLQDLGVDVVWLSPIYRSPQADNGYDISDYRDIDPLFGTLEEFDLLLAELHERGIKLVMDLVVNHTSDEHAWFQEASASADNPKRDWYVWRDGVDRPAELAPPADPDRPADPDGTPGPHEPNLWRSAFSGPAWSHAPHDGTDQYYLHLFAAKQPDLNWENPEVRDAVYEMMNWWLDRGVDGFRMDVINHIAKIQEDLRGDSPGFRMGPQIHDFLQEMNQRVFAGRDADLITVGEMPGVTVDDARLFTGADRLELDMVFQFEHVGLDHGPASKFDNVKLDLRDLKRSLSRWQTGLADQGWNSLYLGNHDQPRSLSRFGDDGQHAHGQADGQPAHGHADGQHADGQRADGHQADGHQADGYLRYESATLLATILHLHRGTPYVYQGDEIGMTNAGFTRITQYQDIETLNWFAEQTAAGRDEEELLEALRFRSRDNARTPVQWTPGPEAGFTDGTPWLEVNPNHDVVNVETDRASGDRSIFAFYRRLIALRHESPLVALGEFALLEPEHPTLYAFTRSDDEGRLLVAGNFSGADLEVPLLVEGPWGAGSRLLGNYDDAGPAAVLRPWEVRVLLA